MLRSALSSILRRGIVKPLQGQHAAAAYCTRVSESGELLSVGGAPLDPNDPEDMIGFFDMVGLFYEKAAQQLEPTLVDTLKGRDPVEVSVKAWHAEEVKKSFSEEYGIFYPCSH